MRTEDSLPPDPSDPPKITPVTPPPEDAAEDGGEGEEIDGEEIEDLEEELEEGGEPGTAEEEIEEEEVIRFAGEPLPSLDEMRSALAWAFEGEVVPEGYLDRCAEHAMLLQEANRVMNLTRIIDPKEVAAKHYFDSWRSVQLLPLLGRRVLDIGSGAGFPGIPIALFEPDAQIVLIESIPEKAEFLASAVETMGIKNATVVCERAEEHLARNRYDVVIMRAISSVRENVRLLRKVRHAFMDLLMPKGPSWSREVRAGEREAERLGFRLETVWEHELPGGMGARAMLVYRAPGGQGR
jgi:16S rRNA (guanine527-N7)-methyltransferase